MFVSVDKRLIHHLLVEFVDPYSLVALSEVSRYWRSLILSEGGVCDELLRRISPLLYGRADLKLKLHAVCFYEELTLARKMFHVSCGEEHSLIAASRTKLMGFGSNADGQLGIESEEDQVNAVEIHIPMAGSRIASVVGGKSHSIVILENGEVWGFGDNRSGALGPFLPAQKIFKPQNLKLKDVVKPRISMASCSKHYSAIVLDDTKGTVLILGSGLTAITHDYEKTEFKELTRGDVEPDEKVLEVSAGYHHLLMITNKGNAYAVGSNQYGQLGSGKDPTHLDGSFSPLKIIKERRLKITQVAAGEFHSMMLSNDGKLFSWGCGRKGQLGNGNFSAVVSIPTPIQLPGEGFPLLVTCGNNHSVVLDLDGRVLTCGSNSFGQTGSKSSFFSINRFSTVSSGEFARPHNNFRRMIHIAAGDHHTAVLDKDSKLFMFGDREKCGGGGFILSTETRTNPVLVELSGGISTLFKTNTKFYSERYRSRQRNVR